MLMYLQDSAEFLPKKIKRKKTAADREKSPVVVTSRVLQGRLRSKNNVAGNNTNIA